MAKLGLEVKLSSPAKINLFLHVTNRLENGYHELQTYFQLIDLCDFITFKPRLDNQINLYCDTPGIPLNESNLIIKAARALKPSKNQGMDIYLTKRIPVGGGLGGGSSNAATTLLACNKLWEKDLTIDNLSTLAEEIGSDVPIFIHGYSAFGEGTGQKLTPLGLPSQNYLIVTPPVHASTADVFNAPDLTRNTTCITIEQFLIHGGHNDLTPVAKRIYPEIETALNWLNQFGNARMTGSGASLFIGLVEFEKSGKILEQLPDGYKGFAVRGLERSPLVDELKELETKLDGKLLSE